MAGKVGIADLRRWYGLSEADFARAVGVTQAALTRWERGESRPQALAATTLALLEDLQRQLSQQFGYERAKVWLTTANRALRGSRPIDVIIVTGPRRVLDLLTGSETGTYR